MSYTRQKLRLDDNVAEAILAKLWPPQWNPGTEFPQAVKEIMDDVRPDWVAYTDYVKECVMPSLLCFCIL